MERETSQRRPHVVLRSSLLVIALSVVALATVGFARGASGVQGVHGHGTLSRDGFTSRYLISVTRNPSGNVSGQIRSEGGTWVVHASPTGLSISGDVACVAGTVTRGFTDIGTPDSIAILIRDVPGGPDQIISAFHDGPPSEPPFECAALARGMEIFHPELTTGNFTFVES
jgi:hypothetical protein